MSEGQPGSEATQPIPSGTQAPVYDEKSLSSPGGETRSRWARSEGIRVAGVVLALNLLVAFGLVAAGLAINEQSASAGRPAHERGFVAAESHDDATVRLDGVFRQHLTEGLHLEGRRIRLTSETAVFPYRLALDGSLQTGLLEGRRATVYGHSGPKGVDAILVILDGAGR